MACSSFISFFRVTTFSKPPPVIFRPLTGGRDWIGGALFFLYIGVASICLFWQFRSTLSGGAALEKLAEESRLHEECRRLEAHAANLFAATMEPARVGDDRAIRFVTARSAVGEDLDRLTNKVSNNPRESVSSDLGALSFAVNRFMEAADTAISSEQMTQPESTEGAISEERVVTEAFLDARAAIGRLSSRAANAEHDETRRLRETIVIHGSAELVLAAMLFALAGGVCYYLYRFASFARADAVDKADMLERVRLAEAKYRSIFDNAASGIFQTTPEGRYLTANRALARMYGYRSPEHLIESLTEVGAQLYAEPERRAELLETFKTNDVITGLEVKLMRTDGRAMWVSENVHAVRDEKGHLLYLEGTVEDISHRWWSEHRRRLQDAAAQVLDRAASVSEARRQILQRICEVMEWQAGAIWDVDAGGQSLSSVEIWHGPQSEVEELKLFIAASSVQRGEGLVGKAWEACEPQLIPDLSQSAEVPMAELAARLSLGAAWAFPVKVRGEIRHILEFFGSRNAAADPELLPTLGLIATELGRLIDRKTVGQELRKSEMRNAAILRAALDSIVTFDASGSIQGFNPAAERAFGYSQTEALGRDILDLLRPDSLESGEDRGTALYKATATDRLLGHRVELVATRFNGSQFPVEVAISRMRIDDKPMFTAYMRDLTDRKAAERITSELAAVVTHSNDAVIRCDIDGIIRSWNAGAEKIYGYAAVEAVGRPIHMLIPQDRMEEFPRMLSVVKKGESLINFETVHACKDGGEINVSLTDSPIWERGAITGIAVIARDVTKRRQLEEELLQSQKMEAVGRLAGGVAHDFNNILTAILGYSDLLIGQIDESHWMYKYLFEIRKASDFAASLTHQLLAFSRRQPLDLRVFCANDTVRNLLKMLNRVIGEHIQIRTDLQADLGMLKADPSQIEQVLLNLCVNARDAMPLGGSITIATSQVCVKEESEAVPASEMAAGEYIRLTVADTGSGIAPLVMKHIFEPFFTTKQAGKGTGLGLAMCYGIISQSGGYIKAESALGVGSTFSLYFPRTTESGVAFPALEVMAEIRGGSETILYIEDESSVRSLTAHVLRRFGYTVMEAADGAEARAIVERREGRPIDLIFLDVVLPDIGGRELAERILAGVPTARILFTSGYADEAILRGHGIEGGEPFLAKPFTPSILSRKIREILDQPSQKATIDAASEKPSVS